jgi:2-C-methyl-D-erythritol 4-phosphate cytidylyltransferase
MTSAIIVAAGRGTRMGASRDKLFLPVAGRPVIAHTWQRFDSAGDIDEIVLVVRRGMEKAFAELAAQLKLQRPHRIVAGGAERQDSVWNGIEALSAESELVAIQDGARPCTSHELISATLQAARETGAAVAAQRAADTIKESEDGRFISRHLDRTRLWAVQTPQAFRVEVIRRGIREARANGLVLTDDTAACQRTGQPVRLVETTAPNPKITVPGDIRLVELLLAGDGKTGGMESGR